MYFCMNNPRHPKFKANVDGARCVECGGLVEIRRVSVEEYNRLPTYQEAKGLRSNNNIKPKSAIEFLEHQFKCLNLKARRLDERIEQTESELEDLKNEYHDVGEQSKDIARAINKLIGKEKYGIVEESSYQDDDLPTRPRGE